MLKHRPLKQNSYLFTSMIAKVSLVLVSTYQFLFKSIPHLSPREQNIPLIFNPP